MKILIFGTGVIGSLYGALLAEAGHEVSLYARGARLKSLQESGLRYRKNAQIRTAKARILSSLKKTDRYDFIILTVRENQLYQALEELKDNESPTIVTMVNSIDTCDKWEAVCGKGRILPAFPGAGGGFDGEVLDAALTPRFIQPTTIGKTDGRERIFAALLRSAMIPVQIVEDMHSWQLCHLAMVVPIADAYYEATDPEHAGEDQKLMRKTASQIRENLTALSRIGLRLSPGNMHVFRLRPSSIAASALGPVFRSSFGKQSMYRHSMKAPDEMRRLHEQFYQTISC